MKMHNGTWTEAQLKELRRLNVADIQRWTARSTDEIKFTCDGCHYAPRCDHAFDAYNTNGDCLDSK